ncbi:uncharacterized protein LOC114352591 [Ostrinia furnacalis]|uniref:uncharacterized protein LOC114352591 n=1 Tax=Ostrinia furnacalis TaxID=93504 RepID=UPI00103C21C2|nr:uncharacterized protein LOC114352591 [Ostrinia furnacalis]
MDCQWVKQSASLNKGIQVINELDESKFEQFLRRIVAKLKVQDAQIFTQDERQKLEKIFKIDDNSLELAIKTVIYLFKRMLKFIFMPSDLKTDLKTLGLNNDKSDIFVKVWSTETRTTLDELGTKEMEESDDAIHFNWKLNAELSSDYHKKCKVPKAYLSLTGEKKDLELELTHPELYSVFLQFESIQNELDNIL